MKKAIVFVVLAVFLVSVTASTASAAILGTWVPSIATTRVGSASGSRSFSSVIGAVAQFEGTLRAYSVSGDPNVEEQLILASDELVASAEALDAELIEIYPSLTEDQKLALKYEYSSLGLYFDVLEDEFNQLYGEKSAGGIGDMFDDWFGDASED
jgi:hypothetical protein